MNPSTTAVKVCSTELDDFAVERLGHGRGPRGSTGKHDRSLNQSAATKVNPIV
jgi:hypothetical protein